VRTRAIRASAHASFALALLLASAPLWRLWFVGLDPTLDRLLQMAICGGPIR
jgi:hypothetical protein